MPPILLLGLYLLQKNLSLIMRNVLEGGFKVGEVDNARIHAPIHNQLSKAL
jgi:hypothetical protein